MINQNISILEPIEKEITYWGKEYNTDFWNTFYSNCEWNILNTPVPIPHLYHEIIKNINSRNCLWITDDLKNIETVVQDNKLYINAVILTEISGYKVHEMNQQNNEETACYICSYRFPEIEKLLIQNVWDLIVIESFNPYESTLETSQLNHCLNNLKPLKRRVLILSDYKKGHQLCKKFLKIEEKRDYSIEVPLNKVTICTGETLPKKVSKLLDILNNYKENKGIIIVSQKEESELLESLLKWQKFPAQLFHQKLSFSEKRYLQEQFTFTNHFDPINILIITSVNDISFIPIEINYVIHFNFINSWKLYCKDIFKMGYHSKPLSSYIFYSYQDKIIQKSMICNNTPDSKALRTLLSMIKKGVQYGNYSSISSDTIYYNLRLSREKLNQALDFLEAKGLIKRQLPVIASAKILNHTNQLFKNQKYHFIQNFSTYHCYYNDVNLLELSQQKKISPLILTKQLVELQNLNQIFLSNIKMSNLFLINQEKGIIKNWTHDEINIYLNTEQKIKELVEAEKIIQNLNIKYNENSLNVPIDEEYSQSNSIKPLSHWLNIAIIQALAESPFPIGKTLLTQILAGSQSKKIKDLKLNELSLYGAFSLIKTESIKEMVLKLILAGYIQELFLNKGFMKVLRPTSKGLKQVKNEPNISTRLWLKHQNNFSNVAGSIYPIIKEIVNSENDKKISDKTLKAISLFNPETVEELQMIKGVNVSEIEILSHFLERKRNEKNKIPEKNCTNTQRNHEIKNYIENCYVPKLIGPFTQGYSLSYYTTISENNRSYTKIGKIIHDYKYKKKEGLPAAITEKAIAVVQKFTKWREIDLIIVVPSSKKYKTICQELGKWLSDGLKCNYEEDILVRSDDSLLQKEIELVNERCINIKTHFSIKNNEKISNKIILLLDDIYDSGTTIEICSKILQQAGAKEILVLTGTKTSYRNAE